MPDRFEFAESRSLQFYRHLHMRITIHLEDISQRNLLKVTDTMAAQTGGELSHEDVWDDSDLVQNWNEAFEEYKKYHSLAAKGEKVQRSAAPNATTGPNGALKPSSTPVNFVPAPATSPGETVTSAPNLVPGPASVAQPSTSTLPPAPPGLASLPHTLLPSTQNDDLKNIIMSWYYAGYYTGLYEGQQKAWASMQEMQQDG
ncbi:hypothetical protein AC578_64 [Pseudocercospora eumusae]|uniref:Survival motor neuron Tudor domain-containing protein n=1 Tax=Pseudocercospora eumusae TaxID=321146 RepID=A0A139HP58_9PEZI|nr:hypothetical protein AC578_64 [Pseudocercospora eumusae]KXT04169.1 hypothetical protein AC578_64 [Pseudocercospora eumusae]